MERDDKSYEQVFRQDFLQEPVKKAGENKHQGDQKKWFLAAMFGIVITVLVVIIVFSVMNLNGGGKPDTSFDTDKTVVMNLYERLNEKMTYQDLEDVVAEVAPEASIMFDDGIYLISIENEDDYITCNIEMDEAIELEGGNSREDASEEVETTEDNINLEELVDTIMKDTESQVEDDGENEYDTNYNPYSEATKIEPDTVMAHFVYYYYGEIETLDGNTELTELYVQESSNGEGYDLFNGVNVVVLPTKAAAIDEVLSLIKK